ncbi:hypothetical protein ACP70R_022562 [Stipagrostis hirtigluma subsp. patula]
MAQNVEPYGNIDPTSETTEVKGNEAGNQFELTLRCAPRDVISVAKALSTEEKDTITKLGFGAFLSLNLKAVAKRDIIRWLLDNSRLEEDRIVMQIKSGETLSITPEVIGLVLGVPSGTQSPVSSAGHTAEYKKVQEQLHFVQKEKQAMAKQPSQEE